MFGTIPYTTDDYQQLELKLQQQRDPLQRLLLIDQLTARYVFTNIHRAKVLLQEQERILQDYDYPDYRLNYHLNLANIENQLYHFSSAEQHFQVAIDMLEERGTFKQQAEALIDYTGTLINMERMDEATEMLERANRQLKHYPERGLAARVICREGFVHLHYADYSRAIELLLEADKLINTLDRPLDLKDYYFLTLIHSGLGKIYERNDEHEKSVDAYRKVVRMCESMQMRTRLAWHYLNVGNGYLAMSDLASAREYFNKAINIGDDTSERAKASAYANLGFCYYEEERYEEALEYFARAESIYQSISADDYYNLSVIESWRGRLYAELDKKEEALEHFVLAYGYASAGEDYRQLSTISKDIASFYAEQEDFRSAYEYQLLYNRFSEQYTEQVNKRKQVELDVKYEASKKKQEAELLQLQATRLQLKALRAQMNPHFMYNALNSIQNFITSHDVSAAAKYLAKFALLMRQSLEYSDMEIISLEKEVQFLEDYLYINKNLRFEDRMTYEITLDDEIEEDILGVPTMIVQPYVENAIEHGLRSKKNGKVSVHYTLYDEDTILCVVEDNGIGREKARQFRLQDSRYQNHRSRGTRITEQRLQILYSGKGKSGLVTTIDLKDEKTGESLGTRVEIKIPIMEIQLK
ncbi:MAG: histidine kinase [Saprospiraceae bacterium]|nr:histidine kinase [Lewinella sp.]